MIVYYAGPFNYNFKVVDIVQTYKNPEFLRLSTIHWHVDSPA